MQKPTKRSPRPTAKSKSKTSVDELVSYRRIVAERANQADLDKAERTAMRLRVATAELLETCRYHDLRVADIAAAAQVSHGTFYTYYNDRVDVVRAILDEYFDIMGATMRPAPGTSEFARIRDATAMFVRYYRANLGLMRCLRALAEQEPEFATLKQRIDAGWFERNISHLSRTAIGASTPKNDISMMVYALGAMVEEFLYIRYQNPDPKVVSLTPTETDVADKLARIWYRAIYLANP